MLIYLVLVILPNVGVLFIILELPNVTSLLQLKAERKVLFVGWAQDGSNAMAICLLSIELSSLSQVDRRL